MSEAKFKIFYGTLLSESPVRSAKPFDLGKSKTYRTPEWLRDLGFILGIAFLYAVAFLCFAFSYIEMTKALR